MEIFTGNSNTTLQSVYFFIRETIIARDDVLERVNEKLGNLHLHSIDDTGETLLHYSVEYNDISTTRWLINYGLDVNARTKDGKTPLTIAVKRKSEEIVCILLKANAKIDLSDRTLMEKLSIPFIYSTMPIKDYSSIPGAIMMKLMDKCETEEEAAAKLFSANVSFYLAVHLQNSQVIKYYLDQGNINVNVRMTEKGVTSLHMAVYFQDWKSAKLLLEYDADVNAKDRLGSVPIAYMRKSQNDCKSDEKLEVLKLLLDRGVELTTLTGIHDWIRKHMQIYSIFRYCSKEAVNLVLRSGNIDLRVTDSQNETPLHYLAANDHPNVFELVQNHSINVNARSNEGTTLLHAAACFGHSSTIQFLLERGANANAEAEGKTPLYLSATYFLLLNDHSFECLEILLQYGADPQALLFDDDLTIFILAEAFKKFNLIETILAHIAILEITGIFIDRESINYINSVVRFKNLFNKYKQQLERLKKIEVYESVTIFQLLTVSEKQLLIYLNNKQLTLNLEQSSDYNSSRDVYYRKLRLRIACARRKLNVKIRADEALCEIMQFPYNIYPTITDKICNYLSKQDLILLGQI